MGGFKDEFAGHMAGFVHFSTDEYSQAFYDGGAVFFSTEVLNSPEVLGNISLEGKIEAVACSDSIEAVITSGDASDAARSLLIFSNKGTKLGEVSLDGRYTDMSIADDTVILRSGNNIRAYGKNAVLKAGFEFTDGDVTAIAGCTASSIYCITGTDMYKIRI